MCHTAAYLPHGHISEPGPSAKHCSSAAPSPVIITTSCQLGKRPRMTYAALKRLSHLSRRRQSCLLSVKIATKQHRLHQILVPWIYDLDLWVFTICLEVFFREIYPRGGWKIPKRGPLIIVAAPHVNQLVGSVLLMRILKSHANRRVSFLTAEKSIMRELTLRLDTWVLYP